MKKLIKSIYLSIIISFVYKINTALALDLRDADSNLSTVAGKAGVSANESISVTLGNVIKGGLTAVGLLFFILIFYGGFSWMIARGNEEKITKARNTVVAALIGLLVVLASYALTILISGVLEK